MIYLRWRLALLYNFYRLFLLFPLISTALGAIQVPELKISHRNSEWIYIKSQQVTTFSPTIDGIESSVWQVEDFFSLKSWSSISLHENEKTGDSFAQVTSDGQVYFVNKKLGGASEDIECELDNRHDHSALFPWRYDKKQQVANVSIGALLRLQDQVITGVGALWLNLYDDQKMSWCESNEEENSLFCYTPRSKLFGGPPDEKASLMYGLKFNLPLQNDVNVPTEAVVKRRLAFHHDQTTLIELSQLEAKITEMKYVDRSETVHQYEQYIDFCKRSYRKNEFPFPNLMRQIVSSQNRLYAFEYLLVTHHYDQNQTSSEEAKYLEVRKMREEFSYELQTQVFELKHEDITNHRFGTKFMRLLGVIPGKSVSYVMELNFEGEPVDCTFGSADSIGLNSLSSLMKRTILLPSPGIGPHSLGELTGQLLGLGALLMNAAEIGRKRKLSKESSLGKAQLKVRDTSFSYIEWVATDPEGDKRFHFYFRRSPIHDHPLADLDDLETVYIYQKDGLAVHSEDSQEEGKKSTAGGPDEDELEEEWLYRWRLVMEVSEIKFRSKLYMDEISRSFIVPRPVCPQAEDMESLDDEDKESSDDKDEDESPKPTDGDHEGPEEPEMDQGKSSGHEFPSFYTERIGTEWSFKLSSRWTRLDESGDRLSSCKLTEWFAFGETFFEPTAPVARLDVETTTPDGTKNTLSYHIRYATGTSLKQTGGPKGTCEDGAPVSWLEVVSAPLDNGGPTTANQKLPRHYGVAGIWRLGSSQSWLAESRGEFRLDPNSSDQFDGATHYGLWLLPVSDHDDPFQLPILYNFTYKKSRHNHFGGMREVSGVRLHSINLDTINLHAFQGTSTVVIDQIEFEVPVEDDAFVIPDLCLPAFEDSERRARGESVKFPTFVDQFGKPPEEARFQIDYEVHLSRNSRLEQDVPIKMKEIHFPAGHLGKTSMTLENRASGKPMLVEMSFWSDTSNRSGNFIAFGPTRACKRAPAWEHLFELDRKDAISKIYDKTKPWQFLVASLWHRFGEKVSREVTSRNVVEHRDGRRLFLRVWTITSPLDSSFVSFEFRQRDENDHNSLALESITIADKVYKGLELRFVISYAGPVGLEQSDELLSIPDECNRAARKPTERQGFPNLRSAMLESRDLVHLRSEIFVGKDFSDSTFSPDYIYRVNEWARLGSAELGKRESKFDKKATYRLQMSKWSHNASSSLDYLISEQFEEFFELVSEGTCMSHHRDGSDWRDSSEDQESGDWILRKIVHMHKREPLVAFPIALWLFASSENNGPLTKIEDDLTIGDLFQAEKLSQWFHRETWQIESRKYDLSLEMEFETFIDVGRKTHLPRRMRASRVDPEALQTDGRRKLRIIVDIIDAQFIPADRPSSQDRFSIPKGFGCKRSKLAADYYENNDQRDIVILEKINPYIMNYKSSLSLAQDEGKSMAPNEAVLSGWVGRCPKMWNLMEIGKFRVEQQERHYANGAFESERVISENQAERKIDLLTGKCSISSLNSRRKISPVESDEILRLKFANLAEHIVLYRQYLATYGHERIQTIDELDDGKHTYRTVVYEYHSGDEPIELSSELKGPGSIVKTFRRKLDSGKSSINYNRMHYHTDLKVEILLFSKAHLTFEIEDLRFIECLEIIKEASLGECYIDSESDSDIPRRADFELEFELVDKFKGLQIDSASSREDFEEDRMSLERELESALLGSSFALPPFQITSNTPSFHVRLSNFHEDKTGIFAHLQLLEPVQLLHSYERVAGHEFYQTGRLTDSIRLTSSPFTCSDACEWLKGGNCFAFSYCQDRTCHILRRPKELEQMQSVDILEGKLRLNSNCDVFYSVDASPRKRQSIDMIYKSLERSVMNNETRIGLKLASNRDLLLVATKIHRLKDISGTTGANGRSMNARNSSSFTLLVADAKLQLEKFDRNDGDMLVKTTHAKDEGECIKLCQSFSCRLGSFCSATKVCSIVGNFRGRGKLQALLSEAKHEDPDCLIFSENFLANYQHIRQTNEPKSDVLTKIDGLSRAECAAQCTMDDELEDGRHLKDCLSFDYCRDPFGKSANQTTCYLNRMHLTMEDFDGDVLHTTKTKAAKNQRSESSSRQEKHCDHYSKYLLSDFRVIAEDKKFTGYRSLTYMNIEAENCALLCLRSDETCLAFEYCAAKSSCFVDRLESADSPAKDSDLMSRLEGSKPEEECKIYKLKHYEDYSGLLENDYGSSQVLDAMTGLSPAHRPDQSYVKGYTLLKASHLILLFGATVLGMALSIIVRRFNRANRWS